MMEKNEFVDTLNEIWDENSGLRGFRYFCDVMYAWYADRRKGKREAGIVILGTGIPDELVRAFGITPVRILGGSLDACSWSDGLVPRDMDPVSRSVLGYILDPKADRLADSLFIIPLNSDSARKTAYLLKREGRKTFTADVPPIWNLDCSNHRWRKQMEDMVEVIAAHVKKGIDEKDIFQSSLVTLKARRAMQSFLFAASDCPGAISDAARILVQNSYYYVDDLAAWSEKLNLLADEILSGYRLRQKRNRLVKSPGILVLGSPVYFPNLKLIHLLHDAGLVMRRNVDASVAPWILGSERNATGRIEDIADMWYAVEGSGAYVVNGSLRRQVMWLADRGDVDGVVYHVLKGQVEVDFEMPYYEALFEKRSIPFIRLETDYQYQDVEQLRIRLEAFAEMLKGSGTQVVRVGQASRMEQRTDQVRRVS